MQPELAASVLHAATVRPKHWYGLYLTYENG